MLQWYSSDTRQEHPPGPDEEVAICWKASCGRGAVRGPRVEVSGGFAGVLGMFHVNIRKG